EIVSFIEILFVLKETDIVNITLTFMDLLPSILSNVVYCALPAMLWYLVPMKGEKRGMYLRLETTRHVFKYYLIMVVTLAVYVVLLWISFGLSISNSGLLDMAALFTQYLDVALIIGIPVIIVLSLIRNKTININERMVLAFLNIGVIASLLAGFLLYRTADRLDPALFAGYDKLFTPESAALDNNEIEVIDHYLSFWNWYYVMLAIMLNLLLIIEMLFMRSIERKITRPIVHLSDVLEQYAKPGDEGLDPEAVITQCRPYRYGYGEVSSLTRTCIGMVGEIDRYTDNLKHITAEKERIGAELDVASKIQRDMLPNIFPPFPNRHEINLFASMTPAKEVGGDFYDFYFIDQAHLALTIADVSGKGVPAALFMVISKTLMNNYAQTGGSPKEILTYVNHQLCQNNESLMFCTVWLGIIDLRDGTLTTANAGHEYPLIRTKNGTFELIKDKHDPGLGVRDGLRYSESVMTLSPGDCIFQYTDGVTEAVNGSMEQFGEDRLVKVLNESPDDEPETLTKRVYASVLEFAGEEPQFDDLTMLCFRYEGSCTEKKQIRLTVPAHTDSLDEVLQFAEERLLAEDCPEDIMFNMMLSVEEIFVNIANYAYEGKEGEAWIAFSFDEGEQTAEFVFSDRGIPFDPTARKEPDITLSPSKRQVGGLGIFIVKKTMDEVKYSYEGGCNVLKIRKKFQKE
ncbi:MAG: SpoIIE family protein phosphatase, partial [Parasporobacterium sp.]|nr:SpoIIE family protein phosphatase [Parasporobacterium sp.]